MTALRLGVADRVPVAEWEIDYRVIQKINPKLDYMDFVEQYEIDLVCALEDITFKEVGPSRKLDHFGIVRGFNEDVPMFWPMPIEGPIKE